MCRGKKQYPNYNDAARAASGAMMRKLDAPQNLRVYKCPICNLYHLTSQPFQPK